MNKKWTYTIFSLALALTFSVGCSQTPQRTGTYTGPVAPVTPAPPAPVPPAPRAPVTPASPAPVPGPGITTPGMQPGAASKDTKSARAIADAVRTIPGIKGAYVIVNQGIAYIAVNLEVPTHAGLTQHIKDQITAKTKKADPNIKTVNVSADPDVIRHFQQYVSDIQAGRPVTGLWNQIQDIINRVWPTSK